MSEYIVKSPNYRHYLLFEHETELGQLDYPKWYAPYRALVTADGVSYPMAPNNFWLSTIQLKKEDDVLVEFKRTWFGKIALFSKLDGVTRDFSFAWRGFFKNGFVLYDWSNTNVLEVRTHFNWSRFTHEYTITTSAEFERYEHKDVLLLAIVYCVNYCRRTRRRAVAS